MNAKRKQKAIQDFLNCKDLPIEELTMHLVDAGYDEVKEVPEIIESLTSPTVEKQKYDLKGLYTVGTNKLKEQVVTDCEAWDEYLKQAEQYDGSKMVDYIKVNAIGKFQRIFDSRNNPVELLAGIEVLKDKIEQKTRITPIMANDLNSQIWSKANNQSGSFYYLIAELINY